MTRVKLITLVVVAILLIVLVLQNTASVDVQFLVFSFGVPKTVLFLVLLLSGFVVGLLVGQRLRGKAKSSQ